MGPATWWCSVVAPCGQQRFFVGLQRGPVLLASLGAPTTQRLHLRDEYLPIPDLAQGSGALRLGH
eukprot:9444596-Alexandrium_andersonii.AAC.1